MSSPDESDPRAQSQPNGQLPPPPSALPDPYPGLQDLPRQQDNTPGPPDRQGVVHQVPTAPTSDSAPSLCLKEPPLIQLDLDGPSIKMLCPPLDTARLDVQISPEMDP